MPIDAAQRRSDCERIARAAGELLRSRFGDPGEVRAKGNPALSYDVVTEVDLLAERLVLDGIAAIAPNALVLGEEGGFEQPDGQPVDAAHVGDPRAVDELWLVDPLDGTINFAHGVPHFAVSVACWRRGAPVAGAIVDPMVGEAFSFEQDVDGSARSFHEGRLVRLADPGGPEQALISIGSSARALPELVSRFVGCRQLASAALALAWTGLGRTGAYVQLGGLSAWDWAAGAPFVEAAGGVVTDEHGQVWPAPLGAATGIVAAAPSIHANIAPLLS